MQYNIKQATLATHIDGWNTGDWIRVQPSVYDAPESSRAFGHKHRPIRQEGHAPGVLKTVRYLNQLETMLHRVIRSRQFSRMSRGDQTKERQDHDKQREDAPGNPQYNWAVDQITSPYQMINLRLMLFMEIPSIKVWTSGTVQLIPSRLTESLTNSGSCFCTENMDSFWFG